MDFGNSIFALPSTIARQPRSEEGERKGDGTEVQGQIWREGRHQSAYQTQVFSLPPQTGGDDCELDIYHSCYL